MGTPEGFQKGKGKKRSVGKIIPRRADELLIASEGDVEWVDEEDVDTSEHNMEQFQAAEHGCFFSNVNDDEMVDYF